MNLINLIDFILQLIKYFNLNFLNLFQYYNVFKLYFFINYDLNS